MKKKTTKIINIISVAVLLLAIGLFALNYMICAKVENQLTRGILDFCRQDEKNETVLNINTYHIDKMIYLYPYVNCKNLDLNRVSHDWVNSICSSDNNNRTPAFAFLCGRQLLYTCSRLVLPGSNFLSPYKRHDEYEAKIWKPSQRKLCLRLKKISSERDVYYIIE